MPNLNLTIISLFLSLQSKVSAEEINHNGPKYFVLTFVLCGCIAGLVLAGIALYVVRRHSQSREKLAQIAGTSADSGEASKDYQVSHFLVSLILSMPMLQTCTKFLS